MKRKLAECQHFKTRTSSQRFILFSRTSAPCDRSLAPTAFSLHQTQHNRMLADQIAQLSVLPGTSLNIPAYTEYSGILCALYLIDLDGWMGKQFDTVDR